MRSEIDSEFMRNDPKHTEIECVHQEMDSKQFRNELKCSAIDCV